MSASKLSDLLPLPAGVTNPHAYQVFGLEGGEQDDRKVFAAMQKTYADLKAAKPECDPKLWKQAVKTAEAARRLLEDPRRRRELDARFGVVGGGDTDADSLQADDPLAAVLPPSDPLSGSLSSSGGSTSPEPILGLPPLGSPPPGNSPSGPAKSPASPWPLGTPPSDAQNSLPMGSAGASTIDWSPPKATKKRRKKKTGSLVFGIFVVAMLAAIVGLLNFLTSGGQIAVNGPADDRRAVAPPLPEQRQERRERSRPARPKPESDGILGEAPQSGLADSIRNPGLDLPAVGSELPNVSPFETPMNSPPTPPPQTTVSVPDPEPTVAAELTPAAIDANQTKIAELETLIRSADWERMKAAAQSLRERNLTSDQSRRVDALYDIADLASYYRGAVRRGLATLEAAATFDLAGVQMIVVQADSDSLTVQYNRRTKSFSVDEMPPRLSAKISTLALSGDLPDATAGLALYRLIRPDTNDEYREDAFKKLESVDGMLEKVDTKNLVRVAKEILTK